LRLGDVRGVFLVRALPLTEGFSMRRRPLLVAAVVATSGLAAPSSLHAGPATALHATRLDAAEVAIPGRPGRTLLILGFQHADQDAREAWRRGLGLADADADARWCWTATAASRTPMDPTIAPRPRVCWLR
jgi:hypothetical protein